VADSTTSRRHMASHHPVEYRLWCTQNDFLSMLEKDIKARKLQASSKEDQGTLDGHVQPLPMKSVLVYSDKGFKDLAVKWLIAADQPISALEHPAFTAMIELAAKAKGNGVVIQRRVTTRQHIMQAYHKHLIGLSKCLNV
ncbi:hypothetical protein OE88DRAFT_1608712, partial [Heliocybe sulcata]